MSTEVLHQQLLLELFCTFSYALSVIFVFWIDRVRGNWAFLAGTLPPIPLIGPVATHQWALVSGVLMTPAEYCVSLLTGVSFIALAAPARAPLTAAIKTIQSINQLIQKHKEAPFWRWALSEALHELHGQHERLAMLVREIEAGFSVLVSIIVSAIVVNTCAAMPMYFQMGARQLFEENWLPQVQFFVVPFLVAAALLSKSAANLRKVLLTLHRWFFLLPKKLDKLFSNTD